MSSTILLRILGNTVHFSLRANSKYVIPNIIGRNLYQKRKQQFTLAATQNTNNNNFKRNTEKDDDTFLVAANDPDLFGTLSSKVVEPAELDEGDEIEERYIKNPTTKSQKLRTKQYADIIKDHLRNNRIKEAIDVVEIRMIKEDRVQPENYIFNLIIGGCGRAGFSKRAFQLYNRMKQRNLKITGGTYTALFNACANSPWPTDGLNKANHLRDVMLEKGYEPNASNYNAMIKAYGRCGDIKTAFQLVDVMQDKNLEIRVDSFNFLLQACASDAEFGFRHALIVWHKMLRRKLTPDIYSFNTLLRCVRDTNMGDLDTTEEVVSQILLESQKGQQLSIDGQNKSDNVLLIGNDVDSAKIENAAGPVELPMLKEATPNLLSSHPHLGNLVSLNEIRKPEDRLLLLGGAGKFLEEMELARVTPNIKTFTELLEVIPPTHSAEKNILATIRKLSIKCDIDFFNVLIKKRSMRFDYESAKEVLHMIRTAKLQPDIVTYGVLALGCQTQEEARSLQQQMYEKGIRMNIQILGAMLRQGCAKRNFSYVLEIMDLIVEQKIKPSGQFITHLHNFHNYCFKLIQNKHSIAKSDKFKSDFNNFKQQLEKWREHYGINDDNLNEAVKKYQEHPWEQFKNPQPKGFEETKNLKLRHQQKIKRYIQRTKTDELEDDDHRKTGRIK